MPPRSKPPHYLESLAVLNQRGAHGFTPEAIRRQGMASAAGLYRNVLEEMASSVEKMVQPSRDPFKDFDIKAARERIKSAFDKAGIAATGEDEREAIARLAKDWRINLVLNTGRDTMLGAGHYLESCRPERNASHPGWELYRREDRMEPRDWEMRFEEACEASGDDAALAAFQATGKMIALKSSGVWQALGDGAGGYTDTLGNPYPIFAFQSGMWTRDVSKARCVRLGLLKEGQKVKGVPLAAMRAAKASVANAFEEAKHPRKESGEFTAKEDWAAKLKAIPDRFPSRTAALARVIDSLPKDKEFGLKELRRAIATEKLPFWKTRDGLEKVSEKGTDGRMWKLKFLGQHSSDQRYRVELVNTLADMTEPHVKGWRDFQGLRIGIENPKSSIRKGKDKDGKEWQCRLPADYGFITRTTGADKDQVDCFIGDNPDSQQVFVIDQRHLDTGEFDETKTLFGYDNAVNAKHAYCKAFSDGKGSQRIMALTPTTVERFKAWLEVGNHRQPFSGQADVANDGTSEGARKGWETRKRGSSAPEDHGLQPAPGRLASRGYYMSSDPSVVVSARVSPKLVELVRLDAREPGKGAGSAALKRLQAFAAATGRKLNLIAAADTHELQPRLNAFYERHGMKRVNDNNEYEWEPQTKDTHEQRQGKMV